MLRPFIDHQHGREGDVAVVVGVGVGVGDVGRRGEGEVAQV